MIMKRFLGIWIGLLLSNFAFSQHQTEGQFKQKWNEENYSMVLASKPLDTIQLTSAFGFRPDPFTNRQKLHQGIDLKANHSKVFSMLHGKVLKAGFDPLLGNFIKIKHGRFESIYGHLSEIVIVPGQNVLPGTFLGVSGSTGKATGDHLHLSIKQGDQYLNPLLFIQMISKISTKEELLTILSNKN